MKEKLLYPVFLVVFTFVFTTSHAQDFWKKINKHTYKVNQNDLLAIKNMPSKFDLVHIDVNEFLNSKSSVANKSNRIISLPNLQGGSSQYILKETSNFAPELQSKYPNIRSYTAKGIDDPSSIAKISVGNDGFHAAIYSVHHSTAYIDSYSKDKNTYLLYNRASLPSINTDFQCLVEGDVKQEMNLVNAERNADDGLLRTYRLAVATSGGYSQFHIGRQGVSNNASDEEKKAAVLSAINTTITRVNGIFERDLSIKLELVANNDEIIFLDANTDGISDGDASLMIEEVQGICDSNIGSANYDIGHVFSIAGSGLAGLGVVCSNGDKAKGVTGISQPIGDAYDVDYVIHELGHQFGATHTQNNSCNRADVTAVEPGSASTIMGYAGICDPNVLGAGNAEGNSDDYFHTVSIEQMWNYIQNNANCAVTTTTNNLPPTANAGQDYSIPASTPFKLVGQATDANNPEDLTYNWEQIDNEIGFMPPRTTNTQGPMFRSLPSSSSPVRYMPSLETVVSGNYSQNLWEVLPAVERTLNFALTVRDNFSGGGSAARDDTQINIISGEAFTVSTPNTAVTWDTGTSQTITWNVGNTNLSPINCETVNIKLSKDGGQTFPITLKENTPNDGSETLIIPDEATENARILIEAADNIFYNINPVNFTINSTTPTFILSDLSGVQYACNISGSSVIYELSIDFVNGFSEAVSLTVDNLPQGANAVFDKTEISEKGSVFLTVNNLEGITPQDYNIQVVGTSASVVQETSVVLAVKSGLFDALVLETPADATTNTGLAPVLTWQENTNALSYDVEVALDQDFTTIIDSGNTNTTSFTVSTLQSLTVYYWRVKPKNDCGDGDFSSPFSFTTGRPSYCASNFLDEVEGAEHILNVTFGSINNDSGNNLNGGYEDFTNLSTTVTRGETEQISVTFDTGGFQDQCFVYIDWNQDFIFNTEDEKYDLGQYGTNIATATQNIEIPQDAILGATRMRVIIEYFGDGYTPGEGACDADHASEWGETEDYTIIVEGATASVSDENFESFLMYPNPSSGNFTLKFKTKSDVGVTLELFDLRGRLIETKVYPTVSNYFDERIVFEKTSKGIYQLRIKNGSTITTKKLIIQ